MLRLLRILIPVLWITAWAWAQDIRLEFQQLGIDLKTHDPVMILKDPKSGRTLPILIGPFEATSIALALDGTKIPRPLTHDLLKSCLESLQAKLDRVVIHDFKEDTFYAKLILVDAAGAQLEEFTPRPGTQAAPVTR